MSKFPFFQIDCWTRKPRPSFDCVLCAQPRRGPLPRTRAQARLGRHSSCQRPLDEFLRHRDREFLLTCPPKIRSRRAVRAAAVGANRYRHMQKRATLLYCRRHSIATDAPSSPRSRVRPTAGHSTGPTDSGSLVCRWSLGACGVPLCYIPHLATDLKGSRWFTRSLRIRRVVA